MILNDRLNCQVSTIFMNPRSIHVEALKELLFYKIHENHV
jgi:hypothetical protein